MMRSWSWKSRSWRVDKRVDQALTTPPRRICIRCFWTWLCWWRARGTSLTTSRCVVRC